MQSHPLSAPSPVTDEGVRVSSLAQLTQDLSEIGATRLLYGENPLVRRIGDTDSSQFSPPAPAIARATRSRDALARERRRRLQVRSHGIGAFLKAIT